MPIVRLPFFFDCGRSVLCFCRSLYLIMSRLHGGLSPLKCDLSHYNAGDLIGERLRRFAPHEVVIRIGKDAK